MTSNVTCVRCGNSFPRDESQKETPPTCSVCGNSIETPDTAAGDAEEDVYALVDRGVPESTSESQEYESPRQGFTEESSPSSEDHEPRNTRVTWKEIICVGTEKELIEAFLELALALSLAFAVYTVFSVILATMMWGVVRDASWLDTSSVQTIIIVIWSIVSIPFFLWVIVYLTRQCSTCLPEKQGCAFCGVRLAFRNHGWRRRTTV